MSLKRRRWANELADSLMDFQARESSQFTDSLEEDKTKSNDSLNNCSDIASMIAKLDLEDTKILYVSDVNSEESNQASYENLNISMIEDLTVCRKNSSTTPTRGDNNSSSTSLDANNQLFNFNERLSDNVTGSSDSGTIKPSSHNSDNLNDRIEMTSDSGTIKASSCNSCCQDSKEIQSRDHSTCDKVNNLSEENFRQRFFSSPAINKDADFISDINAPDIWETLLALEQVLSPFEGQTPSSEEKCQDPPHILNRLSQKFKETPTRFTEKLVSIIEDSIVSSESPTKAADNSGISLHRMTGEFRKMCKFIEDESMPDWAPSLINMTGIDHMQTLPEEKPSENVTPKTATNANNASDSPVFRFTPKGARFFTTPKKDTETKNQTPLRNFTPSADKSFEYWEEVCNLMYNEKQNSGQKNPKRFSILKSVKSNMDDMLTRCERQLASLDETEDARYSEPCSKPKNDLKPSVATPRSKSVSKLCFKTKENEKQSYTQKNAEKKIIKKCNFNSTPIQSNKIEYSERNDTLKNEEKFVKSKEQNVDLIQLDDVKSKEQNVDLIQLDNVKSKEQNVDLIQLDDEPEIAVEAKEANVSIDEDDYVLSTKVFRRNPDVSVEDCNSSLYSPATMQAASSYMFKESDADSSLLIELAKRRQRCLDTAKLMMEIDREDPMTPTNDDTRCVETLYKLGIQDKTFDDVQDDVKFINTLNHCFEYKTYLTDKSKPIFNMLSTIDSPENLKSRTSSLLRSKPTLSRPQSTAKTASKKSVQSRPPVENKSLRSVPNRMAVPRVVTTTLPRMTPRSERKISQTSNLQSVKLTPRVSSKKLSPAKLYTPASTRKLSPTVNSHSQLRRTPSVGALRNIAQSNRANLLTQPKKAGVVRKSSTKTTLHREVPKPAEAKVQSAVKPKLRTPSLQPNGSKLLNLRPGTLAKPPAKTPSSRPQAVPQQQCDRLTPESTEKIVERPVSVTPESVAEIFSEISPEHPKMPKKEKLFLTPGKSPSVAVLGRKKPMTYFSDVASKKIAPLKVTYDNVKSPIGMYVHSTDAELIQNIQGRINDRLLTPVSKTPTTEGPKLKFQLCSKENQSPTVNCDENMVLPSVRYESAKKVCLTEGKSPFSNSNTPNSKTRKLLEPVENTVVIRHEGRVIHYNPNPDCSNAEMSIRVQKVADKISSMKKKPV